LLFKEQRSNQPSPSLSQTEHDPLSGDREGTGVRCPNSNGAYHLFGDPHKAKQDSSKTQNERTKGGISQKEEKEICVNA
jgi:hypothetical protein